MYQETIQRGHYEDELIVKQLEMLSQNIESCCNNVIINLNITIEKKDKTTGRFSDYDQRKKKKS